MGEKQEQRDAVDRMTKYLVENGRGMTEKKANEIARKTAIRDDRKANK